MLFLKACPPPRLDICGSVKSTRKASKFEIKHCPMGNCKAASFHFESAAAKATEISITSLRSHRALSNPPPCLSVNIYTCPCSRFMTMIKCVAKDCHRLLHILFNFPQPFDFLLLLIWLLFVVTARGLEGDRHRRVRSNSLAVGSHNQSNHRSHVHVSPSCKHRQLQHSSYLFTGLPT